MESLRVYPIDAVTTRRYEGNPAGVVANAAGLEDAQMQLIAREINNSETAFILPAEGPDHDVRVRFFTPTTRQTRYRARQTAGSGRGGWMDVRVRSENGEPVAVHIEGRAVVCFRTTLPRD